MTARRRILFISTNPVPWGGSEEMWYTLALRALSEGHEVMVSVFKHPSLHPRIKLLSAAGAMIHLRSLPAYYEGQPFLKWIVAHLKLRIGWDRLPFTWYKALRFAPDHIFISGGETIDGYIFAETWLIQQAVERNIPYSVVGHFHLEYAKVMPDRHRFSKSDYLRRARGLYFVSYRNWEMTAHEIQAPLDHARIVFNPIISVPARMSPIPSTGTIRMAFVARLECAIKCQDMAINTLAQEAFRHLDFNLDIYGEGPDRSYLEDLIRYHGLQDKIRLLGQHPDPGEIWQEHDLLILTSRGEGAPLVIHEAMQAGVPALVTRAGDSALWINEDRGYVSESISRESLTETFQQAFEDRPQWNAKGRKCRAFFNAAWTAQHMDDLYATLIGCPPLDPPGIPAHTMPVWMEDVSRYLEV